MSARAKGGDRTIAFDPAEVSLEPGVSLVEASAGTGKTFSITQLVLRLLLDRNVDGAYRVRGIGSILVVTFTNAATDELITRVRAVLREATDVFAGVVTTRTELNEGLFALRDAYGVQETSRLREALASLDQLAIFTIHGFCKRVLEESALESGTPFNARFIEDDKHIIERIAQDWWRRTMYEDDDLAVLAVHDEWTHDAFLEDLKKWQRLPKTQIDPRVELAVARKELAATMRTFAADWNHDRATSFLGERRWYAASPLNTIEQRAAVVTAGDALADGDLRTAATVTAHLTSVAMLDPKKGMLKKQDALRDAVSQEPFVLAVEGVKDALDGLYMALRVACISDIHARFEAEKRSRHMLGFDDLLRRLHAALDSAGHDGHLSRAIRDRYDAALIDEFQDTDPYQFPIFQTAFAGRPLFLIGDPKQAIYSFRGADLFAYMDAASKAERRYTLGRNWRSTRKMVAASNALFAYRERAFLHDRISFTAAVAARERFDPLDGDDRGAIHWWVMPPNPEKAKPTQLTKKDARDLVQPALAREVVRLLTPSEDRPALHPGQIAVLVRTGADGLEVQRTLRAVNVPSIVSGLDDILESRELTELEWVLRAVLATGDARAVRAALATELWGYDAAAIHRLSLPENEREWEQLIDRLVEWRDEWMRHGFMRMVQTMLSAMNASERLLGLDEGERRLTNLRHSIELLHTAVMEERLSPEGLLLWITNTRSTGEEKAERTELRLETDAKAVQIVTIHKSKGLEYDVVFCPGLWATRRCADDESVLVHLEDDSIVFDHGSPERSDRGRLAKAEELAEDLRLLYVAITRARLRCYIAWGAVCNSRTKLHAGHTALGFLLRSPTITGSPVELAELVPRTFEDTLHQFIDSLRELIDGSGGSMTMEILAGRAERAVPWGGTSEAHVNPVCRTDLPSDESLRSWRVASFTSLTAGRHVEDARDMADVASAQAPLAVIADRTDIRSFPAGRLPGIALHELFERVEFDAPSSDVRSLATEILERTRLADHDERITAVVTMTERVLEATLPATNFALREVPRARTLREWQFHLPLGEVRQSTFADIFSSHGGGVARRYAPALRRLAPVRSRGFLTGVVDLAFERDGRWYVLDWKSNQLGVEPASYEADSLEREMFANHYMLQYHLYLVALHRFLRVRVKDYDYERHIGGVWYAFLRGIDGSDRGWFHDRPPRTLIDALDALMEEAADVVVQDGRR